MTPRKRRFSEKLRSLYLWHRYAGLVAALLAVWLAVTGMLLNHTEDLNLSRTFVQQQWLLDVYNVTAPASLRGERIDGHWLTQSADRVYLDDRFIGMGNVVGGAPADFGFVVAFSDRLLLFAEDGALVEEVPFTVTSAPLTGIVAGAEGIVVMTTGGQFLADADFLTFRRIKELIELPHKEPEALPELLSRRIAEDVLHHSLSWERVLLDLHAGRLFGKAGRWIADIAGALLLLLAISGIVIWAQRARARRRHR